MKDQFDISRLVQLVRGDLVNQYRTLLIVSGAIAAVMLLQALLMQPLETERDAVYWIALGLICFLWGPIAASRSFVELHDKKRNEAWLLLPASAAEKVVARLLLVTVLFLPFALVLVTAIALLISAVKTVLFATPETFFVPTAMLDLGSAGTFFMHQSLFFLGASWFRKNHFVKTGLAIAVVSICLTWFFAITARIVLPGLGTTWMNVSFEPLMAQLGDMLDVLRSLGIFVGYVVLPVFCWFVAWLRVRETQVSDGI